MFRLTGQSGAPAAHLGNQYAVSDILECLGSGMSVVQISEDFSSLTERDNFAALLFTAGFVHSSSRPFSPDFRSR